MSKIICDVCGTSYPETATQCPICGCVRSGDSVTVSGDTSEAVVQQPSSYTYVKGGRFSKTNVKKRNSGKPIYSTETAQRPQRASAPKQPIKKAKKNEVGLIIAVVVLLIAIAAVVVYIACSILGIDLLAKDTPTNSTSGPSASTNETVETTEPSTLEIPCEELVILSDHVIELTSVGEKYLISAKASPDNTTDTIEFASDDSNVATVDSDGTVIAVGNGETVIYVTCGNMEFDCRVICTIEGASDPTENTNPVDGTEPSQPSTTYTEADLTFQDNGFGYEYTIDFSVGSFNPYNGKIPAELVEFSGNDASVATVDADGLVTFVGKGRVVITAKYEDWKIECIIRVI